MYLIEIFISCINQSKPMTGDAYCWLVDEIYDVLFNTVHLTSVSFRFGICKYLIPLGIWQAFDMSSWKDGVCIEDLNLDWLSLASCLYYHH